MFLVLLLGPAEGTPQSNLAITVSARIGIMFIQLSLSLITYLCEFQIHLKWSPIINIISHSLISSTYEVLNKVFFQTPFWTSTPTSCHIWVLFFRAWPQMKQETAVLDWTFHRRTDMVFSGMLPEDPFSTLLRIDLTAEPAYIWIDIRRALFSGSRDC